MAVKTTLQHRRDTAANWTSTNPILTSGEIGFETDTLKFKVGNGSTAWASLKYSQDASLLNGTASITSITTTGDVTAGGFLKSTNSQGDEGGQIDLTKAATNTVLTTGVTIDVFQDKVRIFETGGNNRGYYINVAAGGNSVGTNLVGGGGGGTGTVTSIATTSPITGGTITSTGTIGINASSTSTANYVVQRDANGSFSANVVSANLVASSVNASGQFTSTYAGAPFVVSNTTVVANLNADLLDGFHRDSTSVANTVVSRDDSQNFAANTITATLYGTANLATYVVGGTANEGKILYQSGVNTTSQLAVPTSNNSILAYNTATNAPFWVSAPRTMAALTGFTTTTTSAGYTSLTSTSSYYQQFTGTSAHTVVLPNTATLVAGWTYHIVNNSTANVVANTFSNTATLLTIPANTTAMVTCVDTASNTATGWESGLTDFSNYTGSGSVVMNTSPVLATPNIGAAIGTNVNVTSQYISTLATGTAPLVVASNTVVANLTANAVALPASYYSNTTTFVAYTKVTVLPGNTAPTSPNVGDIWISY